MPSSQGLLKRAITVAATGCLRIGMVELFADYNLSHLDSNIPLHPPFVRC
jgi:hypothetical protein